MIQLTGDNNDISIDPFIFFSWNTTLLKFMCVSSNFLGVIGLEQCEYQNPVNQIDLKNQ